MKIIDESYHAYIDDQTEGSFGTYAEVRRWNERWTGRAQLNGGSVGDCATREEARAKLAKALRDLADAVERD